MKKLLILLIAFLCLPWATIYSEENEYELEYEETTDELSDKFTYRTAYILRNDVAAEYKLLNRDEEISIIEQDDSFYYIDRKNLLLAIDKNRVRTENEDQFEEYEGYTRDGSGVYSDLDLEEKIATFGLNDRVKVIDSFLGVLLVEYEDGKKGYMSPSAVSESEITVYVPAPSPETGSGSDYYYSSNNDNDSGGGTATTSPPASDPDPQPSSGDGEDISLACYDDGYRTVLLDNSNIIKAKVLVDDTKTYISIFQRGDIVKVLSEEDDFAILLINGRKGKINKKYIRYDSDAQYESWNGYAVYGSAVYSDFDMNEMVKSNYINDPIKVIDEVDGMYVVELDDGSIGYMRQTSVSKEKQNVYVAPEPSDPPSYEDSSGSSSDYSGGGNSNPTPTPTPTPDPGPGDSEWTDPVL